jgi:hypothetical protein
MSNILLWTLQKTREQTLKLVEDLSEEQMCLQSKTGENHPVWVLGHLLLGDVYLLSMLEIRELSEDFPELLDKYGPENMPTGEDGFYHSKSVLVERLSETGLLKLESVGRMTKEELTRPTPDKMLAQTQPTVEHHLFALAVHEGHHGGQLSAWRKRQGLKPIKWTFAPPEKSEPSAVADGLT